MKRLLVTAVAMVTLGAGSMRADAYRDSLATFIELSKAQLFSVMFASANQKQMQEHWGSVAHAYNTFVQSKDYFNMLVDVYEPECRRHLSQDELNELLAWYRKSLLTTYPKTMRSFLLNLSTDINSDYRKFLTDNIKRTEKAVSNAKKGKPTKIVPYRIPEPFRVEGARFLQLTGASAMSRVMRDQLTPTIRQLVPSVSNEDMQLPEVQSYVDELVAEAQLAMLYKTTPIGDVQYTNNGFESAAYAHYKDAMESTARCGMLVSAQEMAAFANWLKRYSPALAQQWNDMMTPN